MKTVTSALALAFLTTTLSAQLTVPAASPTVAVKQEIGLAEVTLEYSRPGVKGRQIFGELVPFGTVWRTGANAATKIGFDRDVKIGDQAVPRGKYAVLTIPTATEWTIILNKNTGLQGTNGYDPGEDQLRVTAPVTRLAESCETLTIDFRGFHDNGAELFIRWADAEVSVPFFTDSESEVLAQIEDQVINATGDVDANTYYNAARFYVDRNMDLTLAAHWVEKAVEQRPEAFWMAYYRADLARTMKDHDTAVAWATKARDLASAAPNDFGYLERSNNLLDELKMSRP